MKNSFFYSILFLLSLPIYGQGSFNTEQNDTTNVYYFVLNEVCKQYAKYGHDTLFIQKDDTNALVLPVSSNNVVIKYLDVEEIFRLTTKHKSIELLRVVPLKFEKNGFFIDVVSFKASRKRKSLFYGNQGGTSFHFRYECDKGLVYVVE